MGLGVNFFFCLFICPFFFFRLHFPYLTFLKLFLLSFYLVLKTLSLQLSFSLLSYGILFKRGEMRGILINFEPHEEIKYHGRKSNLGNLETSLSQVTWY